MTTLLIIDGLNLVRKIYEANPAEDSAEKAAGSLSSIKGSLLRAFRDTPSTHAIGIFDYGGETFRHRLFPDYKKDRKPMPEHLKSVMPDVQYLFQELGISTWAPIDVEADDGIGTVGLKGVDAGFDKVVVLSNDKDLCWLISRGVNIRDHFNRINRDAEWVINKFGVKPNQLLDYFALLGDTVDGVPGVKGIGPKTAQQLLNEYETIDLIYENIEKLSVTPRMKGVLEKEKSNAFLSRQLVTLDTNLPIEIDWWDYEVNLSN